jgi:hypothetical protein
MVCKVAANGDVRLRKAPGFLQGSFPLFQEGESTGKHHLTQPPPAYTPKEPNGVIAVARFKNVIDTTKLKIQLIVVAMETATARTLVGYISLFIVQGIEASPGAKHIKYIINAARAAQPKSFWRGPTHLLNSQEYPFGILPLKSS